MIKSKTLVIRDIPLDTKKENLRQFIEDRYGKVNDLIMQVVGSWHKANVIFEKQEDIDKIKDNWSIYIFKESCKIHPATLSDEHRLNDGKSVTNQV